MKRLFPIICVSFFTFSHIGCGPMQAPLPQRLDSDNQKIVNNLWESSLTPVNRLDQQALLDMLIYTHAYQLGVDKLQFRSEKQLANGLVVMEAVFDRKLPEKDAFTVTIYDKQGVITRNEVYQREQVEVTYRDLFENNTHIEKLKMEGKLTQEDIDNMHKIQKRIANIHQLLAQQEPAKP